MHQKLRAYSFGSLAALSIVCSCNSDYEKLASNDYILTEPAAISDLREKVAELAFQIEVLKARAVAIGRESTRLGRVVAVWANSSAHDQLGPYPWFKLAGAFAAIFLGTRALKMLPLGSMASVAVPALLRQIQRPR